MNGPLFRQTVLTLGDRLKTSLGKFVQTLGGKEPQAQEAESFTTPKGAEKKFDLISDRFFSENPDEDQYKLNTYREEDIPACFVPSTNNDTAEFGQGEAFAKIKELISRALSNRKSASGLFIMLHNFILSGEGPARKLATLLITARQAEVPVLLSYDQFRTHVYASGAPAVVLRSFL